MRKELEKNYDPKIVEDRLYEKWLEKGYFSAKIDESKTPFTIVIPPPNITGQLHAGHALDNTFQDIIIRWKKMSGFNALWVPGTDHASISTEVKIVDALKAEGLTKKDLGREKFLERAWEWRNEYGGIIVRQLKKLGIACDWQREHFTMDEQLTRATVECFNRLYEKGYIYKGKKLINWCPHCKTTISDAEVEHIEKNSVYYHMQYIIVETGEKLLFVTSRPETILGDTAIAVNPDDERYTDIVGKTVTVPFVDRKIPIIADRYVDKEFGSGVVKITPAHDPNDFEVGQRHNLPLVNIMNDDGTINKNGGIFAGLDRYVARKKIVEEFDKLGLFIKEEQIINKVGEHERCHVVIEPLLKEQWFVKMSEMAKPALEAAQNGELRFYPDRVAKIYSHWLEEIRDWCISRQLWWGHQIPAWYCSCGHVTVARNTPQKCEKCGSTDIRQDEDVLDTWFSSALWPFAVFGWPEKTPEFDYFFPTNTLVTGYDIIFFWVVRMVFSSIEQTGKLPFNDVVIHGLMRDSSGRKFSKSLGNGIDPLEIIANFGADAMRLMIVTGVSPGNDMRFYDERLEASRNFLNKLWNAARFILMNEDDSLTLDLTELNEEDKWILSKVNRLSADVNRNLEVYDFGIAVSSVHDFIWDEFCDWYIEMVKPRLYNLEDPSRPAALWTLKTVLAQSLKLLHPFMPFITEEIFTSLQSEEETICLSSYPKFDESWNFPEAEKKITVIKEAVRTVRNLRAQMNVPPSRKAALNIVCNEADYFKMFDEGKVYLKNLGYASEVSVVSHFDDNSENAVVVSEGCVIYVPLSDLVDAEKELQRLTREKQKLEKEVALVQSKLSNQKFVEKAPQKVVDEEKLKLEKYSDMLAAVAVQLKRYEK